MRNLHLYLLALILIIGFILPMIGIGFGLPDFFRYDEITNVETALRLGTLDFNPHIFAHGTLLKYILFFEYGVTYFILLLFKAVSSPTDFLRFAHFAHMRFLPRVGHLPIV